MASDKTKNVIDWRTKFSYLPDELLPSLVLGIHVDRSSGYECKYIDRFNTKARDWKLIAHQTAGIGCNQHYIIGTILRPRKTIVDALQKINDAWLDTSCGTISVGLDEILLYRQQLMTLLDVDCNDSYSYFEEGIGPIDCDYDLKNLRKLTSETFPKTLKGLDGSFLQFDNSIDRLIGSIGRWKLFILMQNCD